MSKIRTRITGIAAIILGISLTLLASGSASAGDTVQLRLYNDGSDSLVVTVWDVNARFPGPAVVTERIDGFAWIPVMVNAGVDGNGHIVWTARSGEDAFLRCGRRDLGSLGEDNSVRVFTDSNCAITASEY
ncbi:MAG TPA: hypothetical protein VGD63_12740 [Steroidobacteraceae bacterium]